MSSAAVNNFEALEAGTVRVPYLYSVRYSSYSYCTSYVYGRDQPQIVILMGSKIKPDQTWIFPYSIDCIQYRQVMSARYDRVMSRICLIRLHFGIFMSTHVSSC